MSDETVPQPEPSAEPPTPVPAPTPGSATNTRRKKGDISTLLTAASRDKRRRTSFWIVVGTVVFILLVVGVVIWWVQPGGNPQVMVLTAYDSIGTTNEEITLPVQLSPVETDAGVKLKGAELFLHREPAPIRKAKTGATGRVEWSEEFSEPASSAVDYLVSFPGDSRRKGCSTPGRCFVWPSDASVLVIDADRAFTVDPKARFFLEEEMPELLSGIGESLRPLTAHLRVVYLTTEAESPQHYARFRNRLQITDKKGEVRFPNGPLLAGIAYPDSTDPDAFYRKVLGALKAHFKGDLHAVVRRTEEAKLFEDAGFDVHRIGKPGEKDTSTWHEVLLDLKPLAKEKP